MTMEDTRELPCPRCDGCGRVANTRRKEAWSVWETLPVGSRVAIDLGLVRPVECDICDGTGKVVLLKG